jgi:hypothetical protein
MPCGRQAKKSRLDSRRLVKRLTRLSENSETPTGAKFCFACGRGILETT